MCHIIHVTDVKFGNFITIFNLRACCRIIPSLRKANYSNSIPINGKYQNLRLMEKLNLWLPNKRIFYLFLLFFVYFITFYVYSTNFI